MTARAWTLGPWHSVDNDVLPEWRCIMADGIDWDLAEHVKELADAELIALAPEMAEAILAWEEYDNGDGYANGTPDVVRDALTDLAAKLREIGGGS